jgi:hypothetical protein
MYKRKAFQNHPPKPRIKSTLKQGFFESLKSVSKIDVFGTQRDVESGTDDKRFPDAKPR